MYTYPCIWTSWVIRVESMCKQYSDAETENAGFDAHVVVQVFLVIV